MTYLGVTGFARAGKDTIAERLVSHWDFKRYALADGVRDALLALNPCLAHEHETWSLADLLERFDGWENLKNEDEAGHYVRLYLQRMGTEVGRKLLGEDVWINLLQYRIEQERGFKAYGADFAISDVRFPNEASWCDYVISVTRPGIGPANGHSSERPIPADLIDYPIENNGSIEDLHALVDNVMLQIRADQERKERCEVHD